MMILGAILIVVALGLALAGLLVATGGEEYESPTLRVGVDRRAGEAS